MGEEDVSQWEYRRRQSLAALCPLLLAFHFGIIYGFSGLQAEGVWHKGSTEGEETALSGKGFFIEDLYLLIPSSLVSILLMKHLGRGILALAIFPTLTASWFLIGLILSYLWWWIMRRDIMLFLTAGLITPLVPVYIGEIADSTFRSVLLSAITLFMLSGMMFTRVLVAFVDSDNWYLILTCFTFISWLSWIKARESPIWLISNGQTEEAILEWTYLQGKGSLDVYHGLVDFKARTQRKDHYVSLLVVLCMSFFAHHFAEFYEIYTFPCDTTEQITRNDTKYILIQAAAYLVPAIFTCYLMAVCNRRTMTMISGFGSAACMILSYILEKVTCAPNFLFFIMLMQIVFETIGLMPLPWILCGELSPRRKRAFNAGIAVTFWYLLILLDITVLNSFTQNLSECTLIHAVLVLVGTGFLCVKLPETRGKTLLEIERMFYDTPAKESGDAIEMDDVTSKLADPV